VKSHVQELVDVGLCTWDDFNNPSRNSNAGEIGLNPTAKFHKVITIRDENRNIF
jgi:hypothetical protein